MTVRDLIARLQQPDISPDATVYVAFDNHPSAEVKVETWGTAEGAPANAIEIIGGPE